jgi:hypothetical protein
MQRDRVCGMIVHVDRDEHILLESDEREVPTLETSRRVHARIVLPGDRWRPALELALIDYFFLSVRTARARSARYVLDLRHVDSSIRLARKLAWSWIALGAVFLLLAILGMRGICASSAPWWRHEWLFPTIAFLVVAAAAMYAAVHGTSETVTLFSPHGRARLLRHSGTPGTLRAFHSFLPRLEAHLRIAGARRRPGADHLRDEMREHFRLKQAGVLTEAEYETAKRRILATHNLAAAGAGPGKMAARTKQRVVRRQAFRKAGSPGEPASGRTRASSAAAAPTVQL